MNYNCLIVFPSSTSVERAAAALKAAGIPAAQTRPPSGLTGGSCAYALRIDSRLIGRARRCIEGISHGGTYCGDGTGYRQV